MMNPPKLGDRCPKCGKGEIITFHQLGKIASDDYVLCDDSACYSGFNLGINRQINVEWVGSPGWNSKPKKTDRD